METDEIENKLRELLVQYDSLIDLSKVNTETKFSEVGFDSLDLLDFSIMVEDEFDINLINVHSIINFGGLVESIKKEMQISVDKDKVVV